MGNAGAESLNLDALVRVDHPFGMIVQTLNDAGFYHNSAIFFLFSDHGDRAGDHGLVEKTCNTFEDCLTRAPPIVKRFAGIPMRAGMSTAGVERVDLPATVYELASIEPGYDHFGRSLLPLLRGERTEHRDAVFGEGGRPQNELHCRECESNPALDPDSAYWPRMVQQRSQGPEHTKAAMCRTRDFKYVQRLYESDELYDLRSDPGEVRNVVADPAYAEILRDLRMRMLQWYQRTIDVVPRKMDHRW